MKKRLKYTLWAILIILVAIQFVPVDRENPVSDKNNDLLVVTQAPEDIHNLIKNACYDCHSNETVWPWYSSVAPVSFLIANHVAEARENVNFSDWASFDKEDIRGILKHMRKEIDQNKMPLKGYVTLHPEAKMTAEQKASVLEWIDYVTASYDQMNEH